ncbi:hypothetical protein [Streptomyces sp. NPDC003635]
MPNVVGRVVEGSAHPIAPASDPPAAAGVCRAGNPPQRRELMRECGALHQSFAVPLGDAEQTDPRRYLPVPKNFSDDDAEIRVDLPVHLRFSRDGWLTGDS